MLESTFESRLRRAVNRMGCICGHAGSLLGPGTPDVLVLHKGFAGFLELKIEGRPLKITQAPAHELLRARGYKVWVVRYYSKWAKDRVQIDENTFEIKGSNVKEMAKKAIDKLFNCKQINPE